MYDTKPEGMVNYLKHYGYHFSKKAYEYAVKQMRFKNDSTGKLERLELYPKEKVDEILHRNNITLENDVMYDAAYVMCMCRADFYRSSITDEAHLARFVKDVIDDVDAVDGQVFNRWYADMVRAGIPIDWDEIM